MQQPARSLTEVDLNKVAAVLEDTPIDPRLTIEIAGVWMAFRDRAALRPRVYMKIVEMGEVSPKVVAQALGEPLGNVSYHMRAMAKEGHIRLTKTKPTRGSVEHFYKATKEW